LQRLEGNYVNNDKISFLSELIHYSLSDPSKNIDNFFSSVAFGANKYFKGALVGVDTLLEYCDAHMILIYVDNFWNVQRVFFQILFASPVSP